MFVYTVLCQKYSATFKIRVKFSVCLQIFMKPYYYILITISESDSRQWPLLPIFCLIMYLLGIVELTNYCFVKCILVFFDSAFGSASGFHNVSLLSDPISESTDQFRITSSEMKLAVSAWVTIGQALLNDHDK